MLDLGGAGGPRAVAELLTRRGLEVEEIVDLGAGFERVVTAQIVSRDRHPQADRLSLCRVTTGSGEPLEIVCGAQNMKVGDKVALAQIGAELPNGLKIAANTIRGVQSSGMLCSEEELKLKDTSEGILILPPETPLGRPLAEVLERDDTLLHFKLTANRGDCLSHYGMARELGAALGKPARRPEVKALSPGQCPIALHLDAGEDGPQFWGALLEGVKIGPSPAWVRRRLESLGTRSINNVVDASNLVLLELGHPTHAYDADRLEGAEIRVRDGKEGEVLPLLDGKTIRLGGGELVIADGAKGRRPIGLAGVMGGRNTEVVDGTRRVFLECAEFSPMRVRRAAARHQRHTEASHRFERGIDPSGAQHAVSRLAALVTEWAGGKVVATTQAAVPSRKAVTRREIRVLESYLGDFLGIPLKPGEAEAALTGQGCEVKANGGSWLVRVPPYRWDLAIGEDLAEEVARTVGYDRIPETIPTLSTAPTPLAADARGRARLQLEAAKDALARAGFLEVVNFGFSSAQWLGRFGLKPEVRVQNPLSEEHEWMVPSLIPGLVRNALDNWHRHFGTDSLPLRLFELRPTFHAADGVQAQGEGETGVLERLQLTVAMSGPRTAGGLRADQVPVDFSDLKGALERVFGELGGRGIRFQPTGSGAQAKAAGWMHPGQSVEILAGKSVAGAAGMIHPRLGRDLKLREPLWIAEMDWALVARQCRGAGDRVEFKGWSEYPPMERDFALLVAGGVSADKITQVAMKAARPLAKVAKVFDIYRGSQVPEGMTSVAVRVIFLDETRSLQEVEVEKASAQILEAWKRELGIALRT